VVESEEPRRDSGGIGGLWRIQQRSEEKRRNSGEKRIGISSDLSSEGGGEGRSEDYGGD